jgi:hypothetical protein
MQHEDEATPPPRRPTLHGGHDAPLQPFTPQTGVHLTVTQVVIVVGTIISITAGGVAGYFGVMNRLQGLENRIVSIDQKVGANDPAKVRDTVRDLVREALGRSVVECPKRTVRGESVARCAIVTPKEP